MKTLYLDCFSGISGDMLIGALLDLGANQDQLIAELKKLNLDGYSINITKTQKNGIYGHDFDVQLDCGTKDCEVVNDHGEHHDHGNHHHHVEHHDHGDHHHHAEHSTHHFHNGHMHDGHQLSHHHSTPSRNLFDCIKIIEDSSLSTWVKTHAKLVFEEVAKAEAKVHNKTIDEIHFHEIGAIDSIIDIVGAFVAMEILHIEKVIASPLHDGSGFIECAHGKMPVPVPAVMQMLVGSNIPLIQENVQTELVTPTGMGIVKVIAAEFRDLPNMKIENVGYGMGKRNTGGFNALRAIIGEMDENRFDEDVLVMEANIDDQTGETLGYAMNQLLDNGALDVFFTPIYMKKNRPAVQLSVLCHPKQKDQLSHLILKETSTIGIRIYPCSRIVMNRSIQEVNTKFGKIQVKYVDLDGIQKQAPEFESCSKMAQEKKVPINEIYQAAYAALYQEKHE
ncbi:nickel pincer cofactor biosynthesis protein LarC [Ectobacillus polymachus]|uniref:nickel pincer cofactor biosynthesis protein LarC n=1 Tax=Ectobacillus polymachus TaxID=1508806 RepID=UPI003A8C893E